jgi:hypothetical protein
MWNNDQSSQVDHIPNEQNMAYFRENALEAYDTAMLRRAVEQARKKIVMNELNKKLKKKMGSNLTNRIWNMVRTQEERQQAAKEKKQRNNITRSRMLTNHELLNRASSKHSGGRRTLRAKKRAHKTRKTRL